MVACSMNNAEGTGANYHVSYGTVFYETNLGISEHLTTSDSQTMVQHVRIGGSEIH